MDFRKLRWTFAFCAAVWMLSAAPAQVGDAGAANSELRAIGQETDAAHKTALCEAFLKAHPGHAEAGWVYEQLLQLYIDAKTTDKGLAICDAAIRTAPANLVVSLNCLKSAVAGTDLTLISGLAIRTAALAKKQVESPRPTAEDQVDAWKENVDYARQVGQYSDWSLYAATLRTKDAALATKLYETLEKQNPESEYMARAQSAYFSVLQQAGETKKALEFAERVVGKNESDEEMLLVVANHLMETHQEPERVIAYSKKIVASLEPKPAPEGVAADVWQKKKTHLMGVAGWMAGVTYANQEKWAEADTALRRALPAVESDAQLHAGALFYLGLANYKLGDRKPADMQRIADALKFSKQCAALPGPYQAQAQQNVKSIAANYRMK